MPKQIHHGDALHDHSEDGTNIASTRAVGCRLGSEPAAFTSTGLITTNSEPAVPATEPLPARHGRFRRPARALIAGTLPVRAAAGFGSRCVLMRRWSWFFGMG